MTKELSQGLSSLSPENVFIYVADAVRWDYCPNSLLKKGYSIETISASVNSPTSFSSLVTGKSPPNHGVFSFTKQIPDSVHRLFDLNRQTRFVNSIQGNPSAEDPIYSVLNVDKPTVDNTLSNLSKPFIVMERGPGGHAPYADFEGSAGEYFDSRGDNLKRIRSEYKTSVECDADIFTKRLDTLEERGLLENTLVVYTSDHGELLGEGGMLGHNAPMRPELIRVPTIFIHPELTGDTVKTRNDSKVFSHVDLLPTLYKILNINITDMDGHPITDGFSEAPATTFMDDAAFPERIPIIEGRLAYEGAFDADGGVTFAQSSLLERLARLTGKLVGGTKRSYLCRHLREAVDSYTASKTTYGRMKFTEEDACEAIDAAKTNAVVAETFDISDEARDQLENLGYI